MDDYCRHGVFTARICEICAEVLPLERDLAIAHKQRDGVAAAVREVESYNLELLTQLADANERVKAAEADAVIGRLVRSRIAGPSRAVIHSWEVDQLDKGRV